MGDLCLPCAFALTTNKSTETYDAVLDEVFSAFDLDYNPDYIMLDFESALWAALINRFPNAMIRGCYFHFLRALFKKIKHCGLQSEYNNNPCYSTQLKYLIALAFVPIQDVEFVYSQIISQGIFTNDSHPLASNLKNFINYFERTWVGKANRVLTSNRGSARFPPKVWNMYDVTLNDRARTNNHAEGWHNAINSCIRRQPNIATFVNFLKEEESLSDFKARQYARSLRNGSNKRMRYGEYNALMKGCVGVYEEYVDKLSYVDSVAEHVKYL